MKNRPYNQTAIIHDPRLPPVHIDSLQPPVYRASTILFPDTAALFNRHWADKYDYSYGTHGTPSTYLLSDQIARLEGAPIDGQSTSRCLLAPSGLAAISIVNFALLKAGDEVWLADNMYSPNTAQLERFAKQYGISVRIYDPLDVASFTPSAKARLLWLEAAGSVTLEFPDLCGLIKKAKAHGIITALDSTWAAGLAYTPFHLYDANGEILAVDISVHALTKYPSGGGDVLMGAVTVVDEKLAKKLLSAHASLGMSVGGDDAMRIYRSLASMRLRYRQQMDSCLALLPLLKRAPQLAQVLHPSDADSPGHSFWWQVCASGDGQAQDSAPDGLSAGLVSIVFKDNYHWQDVRNFCDALKIFRLGFSWGGALSLAMLYDIDDIRSLPATRARLHGRYLVRLCIGLEDAADLAADISQALAVMDAKHAQ